MVTQKNKTRPWGLWLLTLALWSAAGASVAYWGLQLSQSSRVAPPASDGAGQPAQADVAAMARLLGAQAAPAPQAAAAAPGDASLQLLGVLAGTDSGAGAALLAVDGQPAKPYRVGAQVRPGLVLQSLQRRQARLGADMQVPASVVLDMPLLPKTTVKAP